MKETFTFWVPGDAKGQPRQRHFARKMGQKWVARSYDPGTAEAWKSSIAMAAKEAGLAGKMIVGPISFSMQCIFSRPRSHFRTGKNSALVKPNAPDWHTTTPDADNVVKAAKDALTQLGVWRDDSQVCMEQVLKNYAIGAGQSFTTFEITLL